MVDNEETGILWGSCRSPVRSGSELLMCDDKTSGIIALFLLAVAELAYCFFSQAVPVHTGTIVGAIAGFITGDKYNGNLR